MEFIDAAAVRRLLTFPALIEALEVAHRRPPAEIQDAWLGEGDRQYFVRHAVDPGRFMASKLITSFSQNPAERNLPAVQAVVVLFDGHDGTPVAVIDGTELTSWRTAADSALGAKLLAPAEPDALLIVGAGAMAPWLVRSHLAVRPSLQRIGIWNRTPQRADQVVAELAAEGIVAERVDDLHAATRMADVISTCTRTVDPVVFGANLKPGVHLDLVGGSNPSSREADDAAAALAAIYVDRREAARDVGDICQPIANGVITEADVRGDLYQLVQGTVAADRGPNGITMFKNAGGGHLDLITAEAVLRLSRT
jgi:ornithine cyclodeaminase/alanine dehydrogenase-like protein (mu-crystallin family)